MNLFHSYELRYMTENMSCPQWITRYHVDEEGVWHFQKYTPIGEENYYPSYLISPDKETNTDVQWHLR